MSETMKAVHLTGPGGPEVLTVTERPKPEVKPGWVLIEVKAFGVNESEVTSRKGESSPDFSYPRVLGIECAGVVERVADGSRFRPGQQVMAMMGGMGRSIDGSYAEYVLVPEEHVIAFESQLPWETLGALPEMLQTAHGSLVTGLELQPRQSVLIRGGTSTVGLTAIALAHEIGAHVLATSRSAARGDLLREHGADEVLVDDGRIAAHVRRAHPDGLDAALELVGLDVLPDTMATLRRGGTACFTGALGGAWTLPEFSPFAVIPKGVRLTCYGGDASDLPEEALARYLDAIAAGRITPAISSVHHGLDSIAQAHRDLEGRHPLGKTVVVLDRL